MSNKMITEVFADQTVKGISKFVLLAIADNASDEKGRFGICFPSISTLADKCGVSDRAVINNIKGLIKSGHLMKSRRTRKNGSNSSNIYLLYPLVNFHLLDDEFLDYFSAKDLPKNEVVSGEPDSLGVVNEVHKGSEPDSLPYEPSFNPQYEPSLESNVQNPDFCFSEFWSIYPKKEGKANAEKKWKVLSKTNKQKAIEDVQKRLGAGLWSNKDTQYIPLPTTYLNGKRWEDEWTVPNPAITVAQAQAMKNKPSNHTGFADKDYSIGATTLDADEWVAKLDAMDAKKSNKGNLS